MLWNSRSHQRKWLGRSMPSTSSLKKKFLIGFSPSGPAVRPGFVPPFGDFEASHFDSPVVRHSCQGYRLVVSVGSAFVVCGEAEPGNSERRWECWVMENFAAACSEHSHSWQAEEKTTSQMQRLQQHSWLALVVLRGTCSTGPRPPFVFALVANPDVGF